ILLVLLVGYSLTDRDDLTTPEKFLMDSVGWVQYIVNQPITYVSEKVTDVKEMKHTSEENKLLREKLSEYKTVVYDLQDAEKENEELQQIMDIEESAREFEPIVSSVIARPPERWIAQITINTASRRGRARNMV